MKKYILILILFSSLKAQVYRVPIRVLPENVNVDLCVSTIDSLKVPAIVLYKLTYIGETHWTSGNLFIDQIYHDKEIFVEILGFYQVDNTEFFEENECLKDKFVISGSWRNTKAIIKLSPDYFINDTLRMSIKLNDKLNDVLVTRDNFTYKLISDKIENIKIDSTNSYVNIEKSGYNCKK